MSNYGTIKTGISVLVYQATLELWDTETGAPSVVWRCPHQHGDFHDAVDCGQTELARRHGLVAGSFQ